MVTKSLPDSPQIHFDFGTSVPAGPDGPAAAIGYRVSALGIAAIVSMLICALWGALNGWRVTTPMLVTASIPLCFFTYFAEIARSRLAGQAGGTGLYLSAEADEGGLSIGRTLLAKDHVVFDDLLWKPNRSIGKATHYATRGGKRLLDLSLGAILLVAMLPLWLALTAALRLVEGRRLYHRVTLHGGGGAEFRTWRLRPPPRASDKADAPAGDSFRHFVWELMLGTGLYRLPELLAVIDGDLSLVGPEPRPYDEPATRFPKWAKAGLTGLSQVSGFSWNDGRRVVLIDRYYLTGASLRLDLAVLVRSLALILSGAR